jgi:NAD(P) transhydrogenase subunit alpha
VLSSQASIAGYKAVLMAAAELPRIFPMMMTAAGTIPPAKVFIMGVGVAGLQAIATAKRLGAVVKAYDIRPAVKDEVLSLGAKFVELDIKTSDTATAGGYARAMDEEFYRRQRELLTQVVAESDIVITTAAVPGKVAPMLVTAEMVRRMPKGSILMDLAAEQGGNCELTKPGETVVVGGGVRIVGCVNIPSTVPVHASQMYSRNISTFLLSLLKEGQLYLNRDDEVVSSTLVTHGGEVVHPRVREVLGLTALPAERTS